MDMCAALDRAQTWSEAPQTSEICCRVASASAHLWCRLEWCTSATMSSWTKAGRPQLTVSFGVRYDVSNKDEPILNLR